MFVIDFPSIEIDPLPILADLMPYYLEHALVATCILLTVYGLSVLFVPGTGANVKRLRVLCGAVAGGMFYLGREIAQWEARHHFDWPGLIAPVLAMIVISAIVFWKQSLNFHNK